MKTTSKNENPAAWYLRDQVSADLKPAFEQRMSVSNARKTYLVSRLGIFFFLVFMVLDVVRYQSGLLEQGNLYFYLMLGHFIFFLFIIPLTIFQRNKTSIRGGRFKWNISLTYLTLGILFLSLFTVGVFSLVERGTLIPFAIFVLLLNLVFSLPHKERLIINLICFFSISIVTMILLFDLGWARMGTRIIELAGITFPAYLMSTYQYNISGREFANEMLVEQQKKELGKEKEKSERLLLNILPADIAEELKEKGKASARRHSSVTLLFSDFVKFSTISATVSPTVLVNELDTCFKAFDKIIEENNLEKIKTVGDAYFCLGGIPNSNDDHAVRVVKAALQMQAYLADRRATKKEPPVFEARIGIHTGEVVSGVVGTKKFAFDVWGDNVNLAARLESSGEAGKVNISDATYDLVKDDYECSYRGKLPIKNRGEIDMYFVSL